METLKLLAGIFALGGLLLLGLGGYVLVNQYTAIQDAQQINATVKHAGLEGQDGSKFAPNVSYQYQYDGQTYRNNDLYPGIVKDETSGNRAFEISHEYEAGERIPIYVDPNNPSESFVIPKLASRMTLGFIGGGIFVIGLAVITYLWESRRDQMQALLDSVDGTSTE